MLREENPNDILGTLVGRLELVCNAAETRVDALRGCAKNFVSKNPRLLWKWVGGFRSHSEFFLENRSKIALNQY